MKKQDPKGINGMSILKVTIFYDLIGFQGDGKSGLIYDFLFKEMGVVMILKENLQQLQEV